ncbi:MAG TPA: hypothetical protein VM366_00075 [Anaerolineae bacterium]|nr:hypothetical protein [Anaerolineae bacterium]
MAEDQEPNGMAETGPSTASEAFQAEDPLGPEEDVQRLLTAAGPMTEEQEKAQRRSFVYGNCVMENDLVTREMVDEIAAELEREGGGE